MTAMAEKSTAGRWSMGREREPIHSQKLRLWKPCKEIQTHAPGSFEKSGPAKNPAGRSWPIKRGQGFRWVAGTIADQAMPPTGRAATLGISTIEPLAP